jgi:hypothetical protein
MENSQEQLGKIKIDDNGKFILSPEQQKVFDEIMAILKKYTEALKADFIGREELIERQDKIIAYKKELEKNGIDPDDYILWHKLGGSSGLLSNEHYFDTEDHKIENFIKELFAEK